MAAAVEDVQLSGRPHLAPPLGQVRLTGRIRNGRGVGRGVRALPEDALIYVSGGGGTYLDGRNGQRHEVPVGSLLVVCAGVPHWYGPDPGRTWDLSFVTVQGPVFDLARRERLLDPDRPVTALAPPAYWVGRVEAFCLARAPRTRSGLQDEACRVLALLVEMCREQDEPSAVPARDWLEVSRELLEADLPRRLHLPEVAAAVGQPYETWRKAFRRSVGTTPAHYRAERKVSAAGDLLRYSTLSLRQIAEAVGFADEHHLSRRFRTSTGTSPREFRARVR